MEMTFKDMRVGDQGRVVGFIRSDANRAYRKKLLAMGLTPGVEFSLTRYAPMGDPVEIQVRGFRLSLRKAEADTLQIEKV